MCVCVCVRARAFVCARACVFVMRVYIQVLPATLAQNTRLRRLILFDNLLEGPIPATFQSLLALQRLVLSGNSLTGPLPAWLGQLMQLEMIILNDNLLHGEIPHQLGALSKLSHLFVHNNKLHGRVPPEIMEEPAPAYVYVNGKAQPWRLTFDDVPPDQVCVCVRARALRAHKPPHARVHTHSRKSEQRFGQSKWWTQ